MLKIVATGPESTGKTTLSKALADFYNVPWVPEYSRIYLQEIKPPPYQQRDILCIAQEQIALENKLAQQGHSLLFHDTSLLTLKIWSEFKYNSCDPWILEQVKNRQYDLFLLCGTDVPWEYDPLRENPEEREMLYEIYKKELEKLGFKYVELTGTLDDRLQQAHTAIEILLSS